MTLIVGLGNPGAKYQHNRHNIGFMVIDSLIDSLNATKQSDKNFQGELYKASQILLLKPTTFMNSSGESAQSVIAYYKPGKMIVIHDDLDLAFGAVKYKYGGSSGGHNGLKSMDLHCTNAYYRIRYGIGKPQEKTQVLDWVLSDFSKDEMQENNTLILHCAKVALEIAKLPSPELLSEKISSIYTLSPKIFKDA